MRIKFSSLLFLLILFIQPVFAQNDGREGEDTVKIKRITLPKATLKINIPALLIDPKQSFFIATDTRVGRFFSIDMGAGPYFNSWAYSNYKNESIRGMRARLGIKYYYVFGRRLAPYVGFEGLFNRFTVKNYSDVCRSGCQYIEEMLLKEETVSKGLTARTGLQIFLGKEHKFFFDAYAGIGFKATDKSVNTPADGEIINNNFESWQLNTEEFGYNVYPNVILGIYFGYAFW